MKQLAKPHALIVGSAVAAYVAVLGWANQVQYAACLYGDFDLAVHAQSLHSILHGSLHSSVLGIPFLGNHFVPVLYLLAPLAAVVEPALVLTWAQTLVLALGAVPLYLLARRHLPAALSVGFTLAYLAYPPLIHMNLYEFHPIAFVSALVLGMFYAFDARRFALFTVLSVLALMCQENVSFVVAGFGVYAFLRGRRDRWCWAPLACGAAWFVVVVLGVLPRLNTDTVQFYRHLYGHLGETPVEIATGVLRRPLTALRVMTGPEKRAFLVALLGPLGGLSLLDPVAFVPDLLVLAQRLLSRRASEATILYHYQAEFIPCVFAGAVFGCRRLLAWRERLGRLLAGAVLATMPAVALVTGGVPGALARIAREARAPAWSRATREAMFARIAPDDAVLATFDFLPRLANRSGLYSFHHVYSGFHTLSDVPYALPEPLDAVLLNTRDRLTFAGFPGRDHYRNARVLLGAPDWRVAMHREHLIMLRRGGAGDHPFDLTAPVPRQPDARATVGVGPAASGEAPPADPGRPRLRLFSVERAGPDTAALDLFWTRGAEAPRDVNIRASLLDGDGSVLVTRLLVPGHRLAPPRSWPVGRLVRDRHVLVVPDSGDVAGRVASLRIAFVRPDVVE
jgi:uncharacterized membrane protein